MTARLLNVSHDEYRADPCRVPSLNCTTAKVLLSRSPAHAALQHPRLGNQARKPTEALDRGALIDHLLLGHGGRFVILPYEEYRTKEAREARDSARAEGKIPVKAADYAAAEAAIIAIRANLATFGIDLNEHGIGGLKYAIEWDEDGTICRGELDHVHIDDQGALISDVKSCENASPSRLSRTMVDFGYAIQHASYTRALTALKPALAGRIRMRFIFVETEPPYAVVPATLNGAFRAYGESQWLKAVEIWRRCLESNEWPGYCTEPVTIDLPPWLVKEMVEGT